MLKLLILILPLNLYIGYQISEPSKITNYDQYVMKIRTKLNNREKYGSGYLFNIKNKNYILTNAHVCINITENPKGTVEYQITSKKLFFNMKMRTSTLIYDKFNDICLIPTKHKGTKLTSAFGKITNSLLGSSYYKVFNKQLYKKIGIERLRRSQSIIWATSSDGEKKKLARGASILTTFETIRGESGSSVFNPAHNLVGLVVGTINYTKKNNTSIAYSSGIIIPIESIHSFLEKI